VSEAAYILWRLCRARGECVCIFLR